MMTSPTLSVTYKPPGDLIPYVSNAKRHEPAQVDQIAASIKEFGFTNPILLDGENGVIAGHGRLLAAQKLGMAEVPTIDLSHLTDTQRRAYILADNRLGEVNTSWDFEMVSAELEALQIEGFEIDLTGFDDAFILGDVEPPIPDDGPPEPPATPVTKPGTLWHMGDHRLLCGDSTDTADIARLVDGREIDCVIFDPPYNEEHLYDYIPQSSEAGKLVVFWDFKRFALAPSKALGAGWTPQYEFIWDCVQSWYTPNRPLQRHKACGVFGDDPKFDTDAATIKDGKTRKAGVVKNTRGECDYKPLDGAVHIRTVEAFSNASQTDSHGHGKPVEWLEAIYKGIGGSVYLALFGGSGADVIACHRAGQQCLAMELDPAYCDVIVDRWQIATGLAAVRELDGAEFDREKSLQDSKL